MWSPLLVSWICSPVTSKAYQLSLQHYFPSWLVYIPYVELIHMFTPSMLACWTQGDSHGRNITGWSPQLRYSQWIYSADQSAYLNQRPCSAHLCVEIVSCPCNNSDQLPLLLSPELHGHISLAHLHWAFFRCRVYWSVSISFTFWFLSSNNLIYPLNLITFPHFPNI